MNEQTIEDKLMKAQTRIIELSAGEQYYIEELISIRSLITNLETQVKMYERSFDKFRSFYFDHKCKKNPARCDLCKVHRLLYGNY